MNTQEVHDFLPTHPAETDSFWTGVSDAAIAIFVGATLARHAGTREVKRNFQLLLHYDPEMAFLAPGLYFVILQLSSFASHQLWRQLEQAKCSVPENSQDTDRKRFLMQFPISADAAF